MARASPAQHGKERRGEERRLGRERGRAQPELAPAAHEVAARLEAQRLLLDEVAALEEPFRSVLVLRYQDDLAPVEIARRLRIPPGTVRWRIHEGLGRLRERLDRRHGGRRDAWMLAFAPLWPWPSWRLLASPAAWPLCIGLAMNTSLKLGLAAAALGLIALPVWLSTRPEPAPADALAERAAPQAVVELESWSPPPPPSGCLLPRRSRTRTPPPPRPTP